MNSVISDAKQGAKFLSCNLHDFFLVTPLKTQECISILYKYIPQDIRGQYNLISMLHQDGYIYVKKIVYMD